MRDEVDLSKILLEPLGWEISEQNAAHASAVGRKSAADVEVDGHDAIDGGACDIDDLVAIEGRDREGFAMGGGHALQDGLGGGGEGVGGGGDRRGMAPVKLNSLGPSLA